MTPEDADRTMRLLSAAWSYFPHDEDVAALWTAELLQLDAEPARQAAKLCAETMDDLPRLAVFLRQARHEARLAALATHTTTPATPPCGLCDGTGWAKAGVVGVGVDAVVRCRCSAARVSDSHRLGCSCRTCAYGVDRAAAIADGTDNHRRIGPDPLVQVPGPRSDDWAHR